MRGAAHPRPAGPLGFTGLQLTRHLASRGRYAVAAGWALFVLAPASAELLSGSSPPLLYFNPLFFVLLHTSYGAAAVLLREWALRRGIGAWGRVVLAAALGIYIEGMLCKSFYSPHWADFAFPEGWGRLWGVNWPWAANLIVYHGVCSLLIPWLAVELLLPAQRGLPALKPRGMIVLGSLALLTGALGWFYMPMEMGPPQVVYHPGALAWLFSWTAPVLIAGVAARIREPAGSGAARPPRPLALGLLTWAAWFGYVLVQWRFGDGKSAPHVALLGTALLVALVTACAWRWRGRLTPVHRYAVLAGSTGFWIYVAVLQELDIVPNPDPTDGMGAVAAAAAGALLLLGLSMRRAISQTAAS